MLKLSESAGAEPLGRPAPDEAGCGAGPGLLVVDDDPGVLWYLEHALTRDGYRVFAAGDVAGAVALFRRQARHVRAALLDVSMPGGGGCQVLHELRLLRPGLSAEFMSGELDPACPAPSPTASGGPGRTG